MSTLLHGLLPLISLYIALMLRLDLDEPRIVYSAFWIWVSVLIGLRVVALVYFKSHTGVWRYVSVPDLLSVGKATTVSSIIFIVLLSFLNTDLAGIPRTVPIIEWGIYIFLAGGLRIAVRIGRERIRSAGMDQIPSRRVVVVGAGSASAAFCAQVKSNPEINIFPVAIVDDDSNLIGTSLIGVPVVGMTEDLRMVVQKYNAEMIVIAIPSATTEQRSRIINICRDSRVEFKLLPGTDELRGDTTSISRLRSVDVADLLGRPRTDFDDEMLSKTYTDKVVMITGAAGTIGSELARSILPFAPSKLVLIDRAENPLVMLEFELQAIVHNMQDNDTKLSTQLADITEPLSINRVFKQHRPDIVFHAAAHKHVNLVEAAPADAVVNNVAGVLNVARAASAYEASTFVLVSSDKAVSPSSVMGATKRLGELAIQQLGTDASVNFLAVRFGNVLGSNASVVPIFKQQIESGGPVTVTDQLAERYFMTAPEAAGLILTAAAVGSNGEIYALDMGSPVKIDYLARTMIELYGLVPDKDIKIEYSGLKPGEKMTEPPLASAEEVDPTTHEKLLLLRISDTGSIDLEILDEFIAGVRSLTDDQVKFGIQERVPEYIISGQNI